MKWVTNKIVMANEINARSNIRNDCTLQCCNENAARSNKYCCHLQPLLNAYLHSLKIIAIKIRRQSET